MSQSNNNQGVKKFYVYGHYTLENNLFYIGVGTVLNLQTKKLKSRYSRAYHTTNRTKFWNNIQNKHGLKVVILEEFLSKKEALEEEKRLIAFHKRKMHGGILCNLSEGGEIGPVGHKKPMSEKQKKILSDLKSIELFIYDSNGIFVIKVKTIKNAAAFCGVTYNAIHSCMKTKNYSNEFFVFKENKGLKLGYTKENLNFKSSLCKRVVSEHIETKELKTHNSLSDCRKYLNADKANLQKAIKNNKICKKHRIFLEGQSAAKLPVR